MVTKHTIQTRLTLPTTAAELNEFASEVLASPNPDAEVGAVVHLGGDQRDPYPVAVSFTASWES